MLPSFLVEETIVRESGEGAAFEVGQDLRRSLLLTFSITHAVEKQSIQFEIRGSEDGFVWHPQPLLKLAPKCYCGDYSVTLPPCNVRYLKVAWTVNRWTRDDQRPFFRLHVFAEVPRTRAVFAGAA